MGGAILIQAICLSHGYAATAADLTKMSLSELMDLEITSVSKTPQTLSTTPAAAYVLTNEDIRRSGATTLADALRSVPGVHVGHVDANKWAISIRGFQDRFSSKLLVLIDGRSVYTPLFSGVFWDIQDTLFEDIDRIEIIRGPGGTIWGANAVNGVINIITKSAKDTHGGYIAGGYGSKENGFGELRYGDGLGDFHYRVYGKYFNRDNHFNGEDDWAFGRGGFRTDWEISEVDSLTLQGDFYEGDAGTTVTKFSKMRPFEVLENYTEDKKGANLLFDLRHEFSPESSVTIEGYYDRTYIDQGLNSEDRDTWNIDLNLRFPGRLIWRHEFILGAGYRYTSNETIGSFLADFTPPDRTDETISWFIQDEIWFVEDFLSATFGSKFEHNDYTGFEYQPRVSVTVTPDDKNTLWGAVTRAVRTPSQSEHDVIFRAPVVDSGFMGLPLVVTTLGDEDYDSETLLSYEAGWRASVTPQLWVDLAGFYNEYDHFQNTEVGKSPVFLGTHFVLINKIENQNAATTYGGEAAVNIELNDDWRLRTGYSYLKIEMHPEPGSTAGKGAEGQSPQHQAFIHSSMDLPWNLKLDAEVRYVGELPDIGLSEYVVVDTRIAWQIDSHWEVSFVALNLFEGDRIEYSLEPSDFIGKATRVEHSYYGKISYRF